MRRSRRKGPLTKVSLLSVSSAAAIIAVAVAVSAPVRAADDAVIQKWIAEFQPSTLSKDEQKKELEWFAKAAEPFKGMEINVVSETITTHEYESQTLAKAFSELTGIKLKHDIIQEGDVVEKLQTQMQSGKNVYDGWINDSDLIGTHFRYGQTIALSDYMTGEGKDVTDPMLDVNDFIGKSFGTAPDGKLYQLPDQQFANLYWFRYDWFTNPDYKAKFKAKYGYELGVPVNWSAYEDIAEFFTNDIKEINGVKVYGHMDYGKKDPSLGWRFTDAWLSMAGQGHSQRSAGRRMGHPHGRLPSGRLLDRTWWRHQRSGRGLLDHEVPRVDEEVCSAAGSGHDLLGVRSGPGAGQHRPADVLVHRLHRRHGEAGHRGDER
jgi:glycerol transport system substrate-binding protein